MITIQKFPKAIYAREDVQAIADAAGDDATAAITEDGGFYLLTITSPAAALPAAPPAAADPMAAPAAIGGALGTDNALAFAQAFVEYWEKCSLNAYHGAADRPDVWTIGWGCTAIGGRPVTAATPPITQAQADDILAGELQAAQDSVHRLISVVLTEYQEAALISFTFNLGAGNLATSTLRTLLNGGHVAEAAAEFLKWVMSNHVRVAGLIRRRGAEQALFLGKIPFSSALDQAIEHYADAALAANPA